MKLHHALIVLVLFVSCAPAAAGLSAGLLDLHLSKATWQAPVSGRLHGVSLAYRRFQSPHLPVQVAATLSSRYPQFQQVVSVRGHLVLSGLHKQLHWLAHVQPETVGASGTVSVIDASRSVTSASGSGGVEPLTPVWLPPGSLSLLQYTDGTPTPVHQSIYRYTQSPHTLRAYLRQALRRHGWRSVSPANDTSVAHWERDGRTLLLSLHAVDPEHTLLYVRQ